MLLHLLHLRLQRRQLRLRLIQRILLHQNCLRENVHRIRILPSPSCSICSASISFSANCVFCTRSIKPPIMSCSWGVIFLPFLLPATLFFALSMNKMQILAL